MNMAIAYHRKDTKSTDVPAHLDREHK